MRFVYAGSLLAMMVSSALAQNDLANGTIADIIANTTTFSLLASALELTGLDELLSDDANVTLFAPSDEAIEAFMLASPGTLNGWLAEVPPNTLTDILLYHTSPGVIGSEDLMDGTLLAMASGDNATLSASPPMIADADIIDADIPASNGVRIWGFLSPVAVVSTA
jgi:uncharacterized surface protein with fasciclin (FAS1) repeats